jgi:hypothetical protein
VAVEAMFGASERLVVLERYECALRVIVAVLFGICHDALKLGVGGRVGR